MHVALPDKGHFISGKKKSVNLLPYHDALTGDTLQILNWELEMFDFEESGKQENQEKNLLEQAEPITNSSHKLCPIQESNPRSAAALTSDPSSLLPSYNP